MGALPPLPPPRTVSAPAAPKAPSGGGGGIFGGLKHLAGDVLSGIDLGRSTLVSAGKQLGNLGAAALHRNQDDPNFRPSLHNFFGDIGRHIGTGEVVEQSHPGWSPWIKDVVGGAGDLAADPLNAVTFGSGEVAKEGLLKAGQVIGDDAAKSALREGGVEGLRSAVEAGGPQSFEDVLGRNVGDLGKVTPEEHVANVISELDKNGKGGLGFAGHRTGLGQGLADRASSAIKGSEVAQSVRPLFNPTAKVAQETGSEGAAEVTNQALHTAANARRGVRAELADSVSQMTKEEYTGEVQKRVGQSIGDDLAHDAPEIASKSAKPGFVQLAGTDTFVHPAVAEALKKSISTPPGEYMQAFDKVNQAVKSFTVFGPLNGIQHDAKRAMFNHLAAVMYGGATDPALWREAGGAMKMISKVSEAGEEITAENLVRHGMEEKAAKRAVGLYQHVLSDNPMYEVAHDTEGAAKDAAKKHKGLLGTRTAQRFAEKDGELSRGAVYFKALNDGHAAPAAAAKARHALLDFSSEGLTSFERDKLQRAIFFYKFPRRAIPAAAKFTLEHPGEALAASKVGLGAAMGERNKYGQAIGLVGDTPLEAGLGDLGSLLHSPGEFAGENLNPMLKAVLDPSKRGLSDILPPVAQVEGKAGAAFDNGGSPDGMPAGILSAGTGIPVAHLGSIPLPAPGFSKGTDYDQQASDKKRDKVRTKLAAGGTPSLLQGLQILADKNGIPMAFALDQPSLLTALRTKGLLPEAGTQTVVPQAG